MNKGYLGLVIVTSIVVLSAVFLPFKASYADDTDASTTDVTASSSTISITVPDQSQDVLTSSTSDQNSIDTDNSDNSANYNQGNGYGDDHNDHCDDWSYSNHDDHGHDDDNCRHDDHGGQGGNGGDHGCDWNCGDGNGGGGNGSGTSTPPTAPAPTATTTLTVTLTNDPAGTAGSSDFNLTILDGTSTLLSGPAASNQVFTLNQGDTYSVTEATTSPSAQYSIQLGAACAGTAGTAPILCDITNTFTGATTSPATTTPVTTGGNNGGGGGSSSGSSGSSSSGQSSVAYGTIVNNTGGGTVLGASIGPDNSACSYLSGYVKPGANNNVNDVVFLQTFLNEHDNSGLYVNGAYDSATIAAVNAFQLEHNVAVLKPWSDIGLLPNDMTPTGYVYKTTRWEINNIACPNLDVAMPQIP